uniref:Citrate transport protein n=1 Tax=Glossina palpalis gambiensis TaxID=67801 RepID=A0A1B0BF37_9MUSC
MQATFIFPQLILLNRFSAMAKPIPMPFFQRPWMLQQGAAAAEGGNKGLKGILAGGITGGIEICITYPTEYIKTQLQLDEKGDRKRYSGVTDCIRKTVIQRGFFGLYRGLSVLLYGSIPKTASRFGAFETLKDHMADNGQLSIFSKLLCGLGAGICEAVIAVTPMETIKVKFINDQRTAKPQFKGFFHGVGRIICNDGIGGIYKGVTATILKQGSNQAIRFFVVESLKDSYKAKNPQKPVPKLLVGAFGFIAGAASVLCNTPLDVIKTRMQGLEAAKYRSTANCALKIWHNEGISAFYKGTVPRLSRVCLDVAFTFMIYDSFMDVFNRVWYTTDEIN